ncbi:hypothetical protein XELAEV_18026875mg [Xenopus laevis]|uniref:Uncharacterized protein n=1 Tax=Xenopus laevis TaxID=8355 RepID=A0A974CUJ3_XENLA|nr:hypothetical protein XELAEV_18026875mg [Xenopus laevis]
MFTYWCVQFFIVYCEPVVIGSFSEALSSFYNEFVLCLRRGCVGMSYISFFHMGGSHCSWVLKVSFYNEFP